MHRPKINYKGTEMVFHIIFFCRCCCCCYLAHLVDSFLRRSSVLPNLNSIVYSKLPLSMNSHLFPPLHIVLHTLQSAFLFEATFLQWNKAVLFLFLFLFFYLFLFLNHTMKVTKFVVNTHGKNNPYRFLCEKCRKEWGKLILLSS